MKLKKKTSRYLSAILMFMFFTTNFFAFKPIVAKAASLGDLVITEVAPKGYDNSAYSDKCEFVEIYNRSGAAVDLKNYKLVYDADYSAGYSYTISNSIVVPASGTVVINTRAKDIAGFKTQWSAKGADISAIDATTYYTNTSDSYNSLKDAGGTISIKDASNVLLYTVTYVTADVQDFTSIKYDYDAANPGIGQNKRVKQVANPGKIDEGQVAAPIKPVITVAGLTEGDILVDNYTFNTANISITDPQDGSIDVSSPKVSIKLDGSDISNGYVVNQLAGTNTPHSLTITATDNDSNTTTKVINFTMGAYIKPARGAAESATVTVAGYVSNKIDANTFYLQDETGGLKVYKNYSNIAATLNVGDRILISGKIQTMNKIKQLYDTFTIIKTYSTGNTISPEVVTLADIAAQAEAAGNEPYECKLVQINNLSVTNIKTYAKISLTDGSNTIDTNNSLSSTIPSGIQNGTTVNIKGILLQDSLTGKYQIYVTNFTTDILVGPGITFNGLNFNGETIESYTVDVKSNGTGMTLTLNDNPVANGDVIAVPGNYTLKAVDTLNGITAEKTIHFTVGVPNYSIAAAKAGPLDTYVKVKGIINNTEANSIYIQDGNAAIPVTIPSTGYAIGNEVIVTGVIQSVNPGYGSPVIKINTDVKVTKTAESKELIPKQITINDYLTGYSNYSYMKLKFSNVKIEMNTNDAKFLSKIKDNSGTNNAEVSLTTYGGNIGTTFITGNFADVVAVASDASSVTIKNPTDVTKLVNNSTISKDKADFDIYSQAVNYKDISVDITLNGNVLSTITNNTTPLVENTDYIISGSTATIKKEYLAKQQKGEVVLSFNFSEGTPSTLTISVADSTPQNSGVIATNTDFDKYSQSNKFVDITANINYKGNSLVSIKNGDSVLALDKDYTKTIDTVVISKDYLKAQAVGDVVLTFAFDVGNAATLTIKIVDTTPEIVNPKVEKVMVGTEVLTEGKTGLALDSKFDFVFNKEIDNTTIIDASKPGTAPNLYITTKADGSYDYTAYSLKTSLVDGKTVVTIEPDLIFGTPWKDSTTYYLVVDATVKDKENLSVPSYSISFTTKVINELTILTAKTIKSDNTEIDLILPGGTNISNTIPSDSKRIEVTFAQNVEANTADFVKLEDVSGNFALPVNNAVIGYSGDKLIITLSALKDNAKYRLSILPGFVGANDTAVKTKIVYLFNTPIAEYQRPHIESIKAGMVDISQSSISTIPQNTTTIQVTFDKKLDETTLKKTLGTLTTYRLYVTAVKGNISSSNIMVTALTPSTVNNKTVVTLTLKALTYGTTYYLEGTNAITTLTDKITMNPVSIEFRIEGQKSVNTKLNNLTIDGKTVNNFNPDTLEYTIELGSATPIPVVDAIVEDVKATKLITQATAVPGIATVVVTAEDTNVTTTYTVNFKLLAPAKVIAAYPVDYALGFPIDGRPTLTFDKEMDVATINNTTIQLGTGSSWSFTPLTGGWDVQYNAENKTATIIPKNMLEKNTSYTIKVSYDKISAMDGTKLAYYSGVSFTTGSGDSTPLSVAESVPANDATNVAIRSKVSINFNKVIASAQNLGSFITVTEDGTNTPVTFSVGKDTTGKTLIIDLGSGKYWNYGTKYNVTVNKELVSEDGNKMQSNFNFSFTTEIFVALTVVNTLPLNNAKDIPVNPTVNVEFSENIYEPLATDWFTIKNNTTAENLGSEFFGLCSASGSKFLTINLVKELDYQTSYTVTVKKGLGNEQQNKILGSDFTFSFTTAAKVIEKSNDATLNTLKIGGKELFDFNPNILVYNVEVSGAFTTPPAVIAIANSSKASIIQIDATTIPGTTRIIVKAEDGTEKTYLVNFVVNLIIENKTIMTRFKRGEDAIVTIKASNLANANKNVNLVVALFDGEKFVTYVSARQEIVAMDSNTITATFNIPKTGEFTIRAFVWDDLVNMNALSRVIEIPVE